MHQRLQVARLWRREQVSIMKLGLSLPNHALLINARSTIVNTLSIAPGSLYAPARKFFL